MADVISQAQAIGAATDLVRVTNNIPGIGPQMHSIWVKTRTGPDGSFEHVIAFSAHPKWITRLSIPDEHLGVPIEQVKWPK